MREARAQRAPMVGVVKAPEATWGSRYRLCMAISNQEETLRGNVREALLNAIKASADDVMANLELRSGGAQELHHLAEAFALVTSTAKPTSKAYSA